MLSLSLSASLPHAHALCVIYLHNKFKSILTHPRRQRRRRGPCDTFCTSTTSPANAARQTIKIECQPEFCVCVCVCVSFFRNNMHRKHKTHSITVITAIMKGKPNANGRYKMPNHLMHVRTLHNRKPPAHWNESLSGAIASLPRRSALSYINQDYYKTTDAGASVPVRPAFPTPGRRVDGGTRDPTRRRAHRRHDHRQQ